MIPQKGLCTHTMFTEHAGIIPSLHTRGGKELRTVGLTRAWERGGAGGEGRSGRETTGTSATGHAPDVGRPDCVWAVCQPARVGCASQADRGGGVRDAAVWRLGRRRE